MTEIKIFTLIIPPWIYAPIIFFLWVSACLVLKKIFLNWAQEISKKTRSRIDDVFVDALRFPLTLLIFVSGVVILQKITPIDQNSGAATFFLFVFKATIIVAIVLFLDKFLRGVIQEYAPKIDVLRTSADIVNGFVRAVVIGLGLLILLDSLGLSITPVLASLGIGSLAVALALQPTLENFFSGIQIITDRLIKVGQFIKLDSGEEGHVEKIGWRSTWIRMPPNNMVIVPNKVLVNSRVLNFDYPSSELSVLIPVRVSYDSGLEHVEKVTLEVAEEVLKTIPACVPQFKPLVRFEAFNQFGIDLTVVLRANSSPEQGIVKHEFIKRLHERYKKEGVAIPFLFERRFENRIFSNQQTGDKEV